MVTRVEGPGLQACVVGAGSLGTLVAGYLAAGGVTCSIVAREPKAAMISTRGIEIKQLFSGKTISTRNVRVISLVRDIPACDVIILCVKAFDVEAIVASLRDAEIVDPHRTALVLIQNGIGVEDITRKAFPAIPIIRMTTTNGAMLVQPGFVHHTGEGDIHIGFWDAIRRARDEEVLRAIDHAFKQAGIVSSISTSMRRKVWEKAIVNAGINAVGALFHVANGTILEVPQLLDISRRLTSEAIAVASAMGNIISFDGHAAVQVVLEKTAANRNSMLQDIEKGRKTEIDHINGAFVAHGKQLGIDVSWNEFIIAAIHGIEALGRGRALAPNIL